jgi:indole-3-glycerol phosphate synthase
MTAILNRIARVRMERLAAEERATPLEFISERAFRLPPPLDFVGTFRGPETHIIAEVKKASPSRGLLVKNFDPVALATAYKTGGASAVSVLTEQDHFLGSIQVLELVHDHVSLPILRKDFITDAYQVVEARAAGADSFLLIAALLDPKRLKHLLEIGRAWQMEPLVEVHDQRELYTALDAGARLIGINNRNLKTFSVDLEISLQLVKSIPKDHVVISESGIKTREDIMRLADAGIQGFLIGESLVTSPNPAEKLRELIHGI